MQWFINLHPIMQGLLATLFTYFVTVLGAATVFVFKGYNKKVLSCMMGFAAGVMIAASFWSLLAPAISMLEGKGKSLLITIALGFMSGGLFISLSDMLLNKTKKFGANTNHKARRSALLTIAVTMHNIPEGLSIGVAFGVVALNADIGGLMPAIMLAVGIGLQNFPEGMCVALPLRNEGYSRRKAFFIGQLSGVVEPIAGVLGVFAALTMTKILPFALCFSAGAMIGVVCSELVPEAFNQNGKGVPLFGVILGFTVMMLLDVALS